MPGSFAQDVARWCAGTENWVERVIERAAEKFKDRVAERTPVDTGFAQSRWVVTKSGKYKYQITNDTVYILALEYGHSRKAPIGMVRVTVSEWQLMVNEAAKEIK